MNLHIVYMFMSQISVSISVFGSVAVTAVVQVFRVAALAAQFLEPTKSNLFATEVYWRLIKSGAIMIQSMKQYDTIWYVGKTIWLHYDDIMTI